MGDQCAMAARFLTIVSSASNFQIFQILSCIALALTRISLTLKESASEFAMGLLPHQVLLVLIYIYVCQLSL
jgi:hypothetical protein